jgi:ParB-like chromosome segregation protein Spo0J
MRGRNAERSEPLPELPLEQHVDRDAPVAVPISALRASDSPRVDGESPDHVTALAESESPLPPIIVHRATMRVIDGMHRVRAAALRGSDTIEALFFDGDSEDAFVLAVKVNTTHGLPLTMAERRLAAVRIMRSYPQLSDRAIASATGLSHKTVAGVRRRTSGDMPQLDSRIGRDGRTRPLRIAAGRERASQLMSDNPGASLREIARAAGISPSTVRDVRHRMQQTEAVTPLPCDEEQQAPAPARATTPSVQTPDEDLWVIVQTLRKDPSLRFTEAGRLLLRLMNMNTHVMMTQEFGDLVEKVPEHCTGAVSALAREYSQAWQEFAQKLDGRQPSRPSTA